MLAALVDLLGKPIAEASALCIPTAGYGGPYGDPGGPWRFISGRSPSPMTELGWKSVGALELTALPSIDKERWVSWVREADALLVNGGGAGAATSAVPRYSAGWAARKQPPSPSAISPIRPKNPWLITAASVIRSTAASPATLKRSGRDVPGRSRPPRSTGTTSAMKHHASTRGA